MADLQTMRARIQDELGRDDLSSQIQTAIRSAVKHYERERFYFNETRQTFTSSNGQEFYAAADFAFIGNLAVIDSVRIELGSTTYTLIEKDYAYLDDIQSNANYKGDPIFYSYYSRQLRLYPIPNAAREIVVSGLEKVATLSASTDTNYWMTEGEELIRARATMKLYKEMIKDDEQAAVWRECEADALSALIRETTSRISSGRVRPTQF